MCVCKQVRRQKARKSERLSERDRERDERIVRHQEGAEAKVIDLHVSVFGTV